MKRFHRPFFVILFSLLLIGAQQAAFAHLLSHAHGKGQSVAQYQGDHGVIDGAAETCATCLAFAGVGGGAAPAKVSAATTLAVADNYFLPSSDPVFTRSTLTCRARAPPAFL